MKNQYYLIDGGCGGAAGGAEQWQNTYIYIYLIYIFTYVHMYECLFVYGHSHPCTSS